ncbi:MAG: hypothetical protein U0903_04820 [Planctomycetales bacterium]
MLSSDEAIAMGCKKYRELYPVGTIPRDLEEQGVLGATPEGLRVFVYITYWFAGERQPFYLFKVSVDRLSGETRIEHAEDWRELVGREFDNSRSL